MSRTRSVVITAAGRPRRPSRVPLTGMERRTKRAAKRKKRKKYNILKEVAKRKAQWEAYKLHPVLGRLFKD